MRTLNYKLVNVFAESHFGGNPLAVFPQCDDLSDQTMQYIARQLNLSETVFIFPATPDQKKSDPLSYCRGRLRIFTPSYELPFAGHPTIGSAAVLQQLHNLPSHFSLETRAGNIPIMHTQGANGHDRFTLRTKPPTQRNSALTRENAAKIFNLTLADIAADPIWINTGSEQLLIRMTSKEAVLNATPNVAEFYAGTRQNPGQEPARCVAYLWHQSDASPTDPNVATVRFFMGQNGAIMEDPGTGSACANLGGWCVLNQLYPLQWRLEQGATIKRPNILHLSVDEHQTIYVGGDVIFLGQGTLNIP